MSEEEAIAKVDSAEAWTEFCDLLKKAGDVILREDLETTSFDRAEGHRYLLRLLRAGSQSFGERTGPEFPTLHVVLKMVTSPDYKNETRVIRTKAICAMESASVRLALKVPAVFC